LIATACSSSSGTSSDAPTAKDLVNERCSGCHSLSRVLAQKGTADEWKVIVEEMVGKGAKLNAEEQQLVTDYLAETYPK
jgi:uncharacterized membrane protein